MKLDRRLLLCVLAVVPLVVAAEALAGALFGALLGALLARELDSTFIGFVLGGAAGGVGGWKMGIVCALVLAPYFAAYSGGVRERGRGRGGFTIGAAVLCAATGLAFLVADWAMRPYFPHYLELLPFRLAIAWLSQGLQAPEDPNDPPPPEDPGGAILETSLLLFASCGAAVAGAIAARVATVSRS